MDLYIPNMGGGAEVQSGSYSRNMAIAYPANMVGIDLEPYTNEFFGVNDQCRSHAAQGFGQYAGGAAMQQAIWLAGAGINRHGTFYIISTHFGEYNTNMLTHGTLSQV